MAKYKDVDSGMKLLAVVQAMKDVLLPTTVLAADSGLPQREEPASALPASHCNAAALTATSAALRETGSADRASNASSAGYAISV